MFFPLFGALVIWYFGAFFPLLLWFFFTTLFAGGGGGGAGETRPRWGQVWGWTFYPRRVWGRGRGWVPSNGAGARCVKIRPRPVATSNFKDTSLLLPILHLHFKIVYNDKEINYIKKKRLLIVCLLKNALVVYLQTYICPAARHTVTYKIEPWLVNNTVSVCFLPLLAWSFLFHGISCFFHPCMSTSSKCALLALYTSIMVRLIGRYSSSIKVFIFINPLGLG